jgi:hypothetical protein
MRSRFDVAQRVGVGQLAKQNALRIQIWTALIAILLLKWLHNLSKAKWSLFESGFYAAAEPVYLSRIERLAG